MDFWELTKLLFRRWYIAVPMLLISVTAALFAGASVKPDYDAKLHIQLIPPLANPTPGQPHNPWVDLGIDSVGNATMIAVADQTVLDGLVQDGYSDNVVVTMDGHAPIITIEVVASSPKLATASAHAMATVVDQHVLSLQKAYGAPDSQLITTRSLDTGDNVQTVTSKVKRAAAVIGGVGLLVTSAVTIGLDALLRNRSRRKAARTVAAASEDQPEPPSGATQALPEGKSGNARIRTGGSIAADNTQVFRSDSWAPNADPGGADKPAEVPAAAPLGLPDDATIVLPLPHKEEQWAQARGSKRR